MTTRTSAVRRPAVRKAIASETSSIAAVLAHAFVDDPVMRWVIPDDVRRRRLLPEFFELYAATFQAYDEVYVSGDGDGAALWAPPGQPAIADADADAVVERMTSILGPDAARGLELSALLDDHHPHEPLFYLQFLGVDPRRQGRGVGSALLVTVLERCDEQGVPAYLDATSPRNRRLYERHGFTAIAELAPASGPPLWPMLRTPRPRQAATSADPTGRWPR